MDYILYSLSENIRFVFVYRIFPNNPRLTQQQDDESKGKWITLQNSTWMKRRKNNKKLGTEWDLCNVVVQPNWINEWGFVYLIHPFRDRHSTCHSQGHSEKRHRHVIKEKVSTNWQRATMTATNYPCSFATVLFPLSTCFYFPAPSYYPDTPPTHLPRNKNLSSKSSWFHYYSFNN